MNRFKFYFSSLLPFFVLGFFLSLSGPKPLGEWVSSNTLAIFFFFATILAGAWLFTPISVAHPTRVISDLEEECYYSFFTFPIYVLLFVFLTQVKDYHILVFTMVVFALWWTAIPAEHVYNPIFRLLGWRLYSGKLSGRTRRMYFIAQTPLQNGDTVRFIDLDDSGCLVSLSRRDKCSSR